MPYYTKIRPFMAGVINLEVQCRNQRGQDGRRTCDILLRNSLKTDITVWGRARTGLHINNYFPRTTRSRILEKSIVIESIKIFPSFCGIRRNIAVFDNS